MKKQRARSFEKERALSDTSKTVNQSFRCAKALETSVILMDFSLAP